MSFENQTKLSLLREGYEKLDLKIEEARKPSEQTKRMAVVFMENIDLINKRVVDTQEIDHLMSSSLLKNLNSIFFNKEISQEEYDKLKRVYVNFSLRRYDAIDPNILQESVAEMIYQIIYGDYNTFVEQSGKALEKYTIPINDYLQSSGYLDKGDLENISTRLKTVSVQKIKFFVNSDILKILYSMPGYLEPNIAGYYDPTSHQITIPAIGKVSNVLYDEKEENKITMIPEEHEHYEAVGIFYKFKNFETNIHELLHAASCHNFFVDLNEELATRRSGLRASGLDKPYRLWKLDEAVIEHMTIDIIISHLEKTLSGEQMTKLRAARFFVGSYKSERAYLKKLLEKIDFSYFVKAVFNEEALMDLQRQVKEKMGKTLLEIYQ
jgi:hypothetical protein